MKLTNLLLIIVILMFGTNILIAKPKTPAVDCNVTSISEPVIKELKKRIGVF